MRFLRFFNRSRLLSNILIGVNAVLLIILAFNAVPFFEDFGLNSTTKSDLLFMLGCAVWLALAVIIIALKCIVKDAEEDLKAVVGMAKKED